MTVKVLVQQQRIIPKQPTIRPTRIPPPPAPPPPPPPPPLTQPVLSRRQGIEWTLLAAAGVGATVLFGTIRNLTKLSPDPFLSKTSRFRYNNNGRLFLQQKNSSWMGVITDLMNPGRLLLRDERGNMYYWDLYLSDDIKQVDLTSQEMIMSILARYPDWEENLIPLPLLPVYDSFQASDKEFRSGLRYDKEDDMYYWIPDLSNTELQKELSKAAKNGFQLQ